MRAKFLKAMGWDENFNGMGWVRAGDGMDADQILLKERGHGVKNCKTLFVVANCGAPKLGEHPIMKWDTLSTNPSFHHLLTGAREGI